jgi:hypothetical protein
MQTLSVPARAMAASRETLSPADRQPSLRLRAGFRPQRLLPNPDGRVDRS